MFVQRNFVVQICFGSKRYFVQKTLGPKKFVFNKILGCLCCCPCPHHRWPWLGCCCCVCCYCCCSCCCFTISFKKFLMVFYFTKQDYLKEIYMVLRLTSSSCVDFLRLKFCPKYTFWPKFYWNSNPKILEPWSLPGPNWYIFLNSSLDNK